MHQVIHKEIARPPLVVWHYAHLADQGCGGNGNEAAGVKLELLYAAAALWLSNQRPQGQRAPAVIQNWRFQGVSTLQQLHLP